MPSGASDFFVFLHKGFRGVTLLNDDGVQTQFHLGPLHDPLLHRVFRNVTKDAHLLLLANSVGSVLMGLKKSRLTKGTSQVLNGATDLQNSFNCIWNGGANHGLKIYLRIPVWVVQDHHVCRSQVDSQSSSSGAQHEDELTAVGLVEHIDRDLQAFKVRGIRYLLNSSTKLNPPK